MQLCSGLSQLQKVFVIVRIQDGIGHGLMANTRILRLLSASELFQKFINLGLVGWIRACWLGRLLLIWLVDSRWSTFQIRFWSRFWSRFLFLLSEVLKVPCFVCRWYVSTNFVSRWLIVSLSLEIRSLLHPLPDWVLTLCFKLSALGCMPPLYVSRVLGVNSVISSTSLYAHIPLFPIRCTTLAHLWTQ